jgi:imidazolonepropionase-like amidohydrolase
MKGIDVFPKPRWSWPRQLAPFLRAVVTLVVAAAISACAPAASAPPSDAGVSARTAAMVFVGARLIDGTGSAPIDNGVLVVRVGRIDAIGPASAIAVPTDALRIDVSGKTIVPGLINAHGHVGNVFGLRSGPEFETRANVERQLGLYARAGVTSVFSLGDEPKAAFEVRADQRASPSATTRLALAGPVIAADNEADARAKVRDNAALQPDFLKIRVDDNLGTSPKMPQAVWDAVIDESHKLGFRVAAHVYYQADAQRLIERDVDLIAHSIRDQPVSADTIARFRDKNVCLVPTLARELSTYVYESTPAFFDDPFFRREVDPAVIDELTRPSIQDTYRASREGQIYKAQLPVAMRNLKALFEAGVPIAMGTDSGPVARFQGYFEHVELEMMVEAGLTPAQALTTATSTAAKCLNVWDHVGSLKPGLDADFIVLTSNPLEDIRHTRAIESVWIGGTRVPPRPASAP